MNPEPMSNILTSPLSIAPMIDWTYTHFRVLMRILAPQVLLYTEMQTTGAVINNPVRALDYRAIEHPIALQLGGADKKALAECAKVAEQAGYDEINLNLGCPSDKVQAGHFGACLMKQVDLVSECIESMKQTVSIPVTAKTRIGIDHQDSYEFFSAFVKSLVLAGCDKLIIHARKAWLTGLNPKQNRTIPPVNYDYVYRLAKELVDTPIIINGNITNQADIDDHLQQVDGVMLGRLACDNPYKIAIIHQALYPESKLLKRHEVLTIYIDYLMNEFNQGVALSLLLKPLFNLAHGLPGASLWKQKLMAILQTKNTSPLQELSAYLQEIESQELASV